MNKAQLSQIVEGMKETAIAQATQYATLVDTEVPGSDAATIVGLTWAGILKAPESRRVDR